MISASSSSNSLHSLLELLQEVLPAAENESTTTTLVEPLAEWNDQIEPILFGPSSSVLSNEHDEDSVNAVSQHLQRLLLTQLLRQLYSESDKEEEDGVDDENSMDWSVMDTQALAATVVAHFRGSDDNDGAKTGYETAILTDDSELFKEVLRTCKNWLRWYLQIYIFSTSSTPASTTSTALQQWHSCDMLELYLLLLEQSVPEAPTVARLVSQLFFYASYDHSTVQGANNFIQLAYAFLVQDLQYFSRVLTLLVLVHNHMSNCAQTGTRWSALVALALSLVRNVHNILATYPSAKAAVEAATILTVPDNPGVVNNESSSDDDLNTATMALTTISATSTTILPTRIPCACLTIMLDLLDTVRQVTPSDPTESFNPEQQQQQQQQHADLTLEILRTFYALGVGHHLAAPIQDDRLARCLLELLTPRVPTAAATTSVAALGVNSKKGSSSGNIEIPLATLSVLMDASPTFSEYIVQQDAVQPVLSLLERQVTHIIESSLVDERGAAACLPVLVVVHRFCQANLLFRNATKEAVFPEADEAKFQRLVVAQQQKSGVTGGAKNMVPIDAPVGTLRHKLIRLLTWPEGHIKRFASEILWTLCGSDATEFTFRVGMGNGMPFLGAKGMVELPAHVFS